MIEEIYGQIHYYNFDRIHRSLKMSPVQFAALRFPDYCLHEMGGRDTLLSFIGMLSSLYVAIMGPIIGGIADVSVPMACAFMGGLIMVRALVFG